MKRKLKKTIGRSIVLVACLSITSNLYAQNNSNGNGKLWERETGTDNIYKLPVEGNVGIGTLTPETPLDVQGMISADSIHSHGNIIVGDSTYYLMNNINTINGPCDQIRTDNGRFALIKGTSSSLAGSWNILFGVGTQTPQTKMHLWDRNLIDVYTTYTHGTANSANTNGLQVGIDADRNGIFNNRVDKPIYLKTNNETRMRISRNATNNKTRVSITNGYEPWSLVSMLNIGNFPVTSQ